MANFPLSGSENETYLLALHLRQCGFGLGQPEGHVHGAVQVDGGGQGGAGLLALAGLAIQPAQAEVAVGLQWAHAECLGQGQGLLVVRFGWLDLRGIAPRRNVAEEGEDIRLIVSFLALLGEGQRLMGSDVPLLHTASQDIGLA